MALYSELQSQVHSRLIDEQYTHNLVLIQFYKRVLNDERINSRIHTAIWTGPTSSRGRLGLSILIRGLPGVVLSLKDRPVVAILFLMSVVLSPSFVTLASCYMKLSTFFLLNYLPRQAGFTIASTIRISWHSVNTSHFLAFSQHFAFFGIQL